MDVLQADATRCGGFTGFLRAAALCEAHCMPLSAHCAPDLHAHACLAAPRAVHVEYFHDHVRIERMLFDGALAPRDGRAATRPLEPGNGLELRRGRARRVPARGGGDDARSAADARRAAHREHGAGTATAGRRSRRWGGRDGRRRAPRARARRGGRGRGALRRRGARRSTPRRLELPPGADRRGASRATSEDVIEAVRVCREHGAPDARRAAAARSLAGQCCNVAVVLDFTQVHEPRCSRSIPSGELARVQPGCVLDDLRDARRAARADLRPRPGHPRPLHAGRHDRATTRAASTRCWPQYYGPGPRTEHQRASLEVLTYDGTRLRGRAARRTQELERIAARRRPPRRDLRAAARRCATATRRSIRERFPDIPRRVSGYNLPALLPENGLRRRARAVRHRGHVRRRCSRRRCSSCRRAAADALVVRRLRRASSRPPTTWSGDHASTVRSAWRASTRGSSQDMRHKGLHTEDLRLHARRARAGCSSRSGADEREEAERTGARADAGAARGATTRRRHAPVRRRGRAGEGLGGARVGARRDGVRARPCGRRGPAGRTRPCRPSALGRLPARAPALLERYGLRGALYGHFGQGCVHTRIDFDLRTREGIETLPPVHRARPPTWSCGTAARCPASTATASRAGRCSARCTATELLEAFREFKRIWDPDWRMNPGKVVDAYGAGPRTCAWARTTDPGRATPSSHYANDVGGFAAATERCVGVGKCRRDEGGVDVSRRTWSRARRCTRRAAARTCCSR